MTRSPISPDLRPVPAAAGATASTGAATPAGGPTAAGDAACTGATDSANSIDALTLDRARRGDPEAHALLYARFAPTVFTLARRMTASTSRAEDVLQDTFVDVIRNVDRFRNEADIGTWIRRIAVNKCLSLFRSHWWASRVDLDDADRLVGQRDQTAAHSALELERLLDSLPPVARAVVWLHDAEGYTHREIGALMGKTASFSKTQLHRAHQRLRTALGPAPAEPTPEAEEFEEMHTLCAKALKTT